MRTRPRTAAAFAGTLLALALTACGGDEPTAVDPVPPSATASASEPEPTESANEPQSAESASEPEPPGPDRTANAAFLNRLKAGIEKETSVHMSMKMTGAAEITAESDVSSGPDGTETHLVMEMSTLPGGLMELIVADGKAYMSMPGVTARGKFFEIDQSDPMFKQFNQNSSPEDSLVPLEAGLESFKKVGTGKIAGDELTRYRLQVDAKKSLRASGLPLAPGVPETLAYDLWVDSQDRMRRLALDVPGTKVVMEMNAWGKDVDITPPDKEDIVDAPQAMS